MKIAVLITGGQGAGGAGGGTRLQAPEAQERARHGGQGSRWPDRSLGGRMARWPGDSGGGRGVGGGGTEGKQRYLRVAASSDRQDRDA